MTRINLIPPDQLADQHLFAEFREIKMIPKSLNRSLAAVISKNPYHTIYPHDVVGQLLARIPKKFTLNTGHVSFFYDKGAYLYRWYSMLREELRLRGINFNQASELDPDKVFERDTRLMGRLHTNG